MTKPKQPKPHPASIVLDVGEHALGTRIHNTILAWRPRTCSERVVGATITLHPELRAALLVSGELNLQDDKYSWYGMPLEVTEDPRHSPTNITIRLLTIDGPQR